MSGAEVSSLFNRDLELFLARKYVTIKKNLKKDALVALVLSHVAREDKETVHEVPLKDGDTQEEQSERDQSRDFAAVRAIDAACAEQLPAERDQSGVSADDTAVLAINAARAAQFKLAFPSHAQNPVQAARRECALSYPCLLKDPVAVSEQESAVVPSQADNSIQNPAQVELEQALSNPCPPLVVKALDLVAVSVVGSSLFYVQPGVKECVDKFGEMLAKWSAESEELIRGFQQLNGDAKTNIRFLSVLGRQH